MGIDRAIDITGEQRKTVLALLERHLPNTTAWVYGSRAKWTSRPQSDLDVVVFATPEQTRQVSDLREAFEESNLPFRVDLFVWDDVPEQFRKQIEAEHVVLVEREEQLFKKRRSGAGGEWVRRRIGALGRVVTGKTPSTVEKSNFDGPYPFITIPDLDGRVLIENTKRTLSDKGAAILRTCLLPPGAVLMSCIATVGRCGVTTRVSFTNQQINSVIPGDGVDSRFLYYVFTQLGHELESTGGGGSVYTNVSKSRFSDIEVVIPVDVTEQRAIAHVLGTLDDKIELNRRMNETLEAMARTLFKSWFVDFLPVRAKMEGLWRKGESLPGLPAYLYNLFPDRLADSELGEIPDGWEVSVVGDIANVSSGKRPSVRCPVASTESAVPVWGGNGPIAFTSEPLVDYPVLITGRVGTLGSVFRVSSPCWPSDNTLTIRARNNQHFEYLYFQMERIDFNSLNRGSTQPLLTQSDLGAQPIILPPLGILEHFTGLIGLLFNRYDGGKWESDTLAVLRDALSPNLVSGEERVDYSQEIGNMLA